MVKKCVNKKSQKGTLPLELNDEDFPNIYQITLRHIGKISNEIEETLIKAGQIRKEKIYTDAKLIQYAKFFYKIKCDVELIYTDGTILESVDDLFPQERQGDKIHVVFKHIRNLVDSDPIVGYKENVFFTQRGFELENHLCTENTFEPFIQSLMKNIPLNNLIMQDFKKEVYISRHKFDEFKSYLIRKVLGYSCNADDLLEIQNQYEINVGNHFVKADHAVIQLWNERAILISDAKMIDMDKGLIQCLDQLRTYAHSSSGKEFPIFYGVVSNFERWRFCCYIPPRDKKKTDKKENFQLSAEFRLNVDLTKLDGETKQDNVGILIGILRSLHDPKIDHDVAQKLQFPQEELAKIEEFVALQAQKQQTKQQQILNHLEGMKKTYEEDNRRWGYREYGTWK